MKLITAFVTLIALSSVGRCVIPVIDGAHIAQDGYNEVVNFLKWAKQETDEAATELHTLGTYENTILQVARMGDPNQLRNLPVISSVESLFATSQQALAEYQQLRYMTSPQYLEGQMNQIKSAYNLQGWNTPYPINYQFPSANYGVAQSAQQTLQRLETQRRTLEQQRDEAMNSLTSASTDAQVQKFHGALTAVNGALAEVAAREQGLMHQVQLQQQQLESGRQVQQQQQREQVGTSFQAGINSTLQTMGQAGQNFGRTPRWKDIAP
jgi:hypothetical protein